MVNIIKIPHPTAVSFKSMVLLFIYCLLLQPLMYVGFLFDPCLVIYIVPSPQSCFAIISLRKRTALLFFNRVAISVSLVFVSLSHTGECWSVTCDKPFHRHTRFLIRHLCAYHLFA